MISSRQTLSSLMSYVAKDIQGYAANTRESSRLSALGLSASSGMQSSANNPLRSNTGFAGVTRNVADDKYVGSGLNLKLDLSSGQSIELDIQQTIGGGIRNVSLETKGELSLGDQEKLKQFLAKLSNAIDGLFTGSGGQAAFDFANMSGIKDIELNVQLDGVSDRQRLEFEKHHTQHGRKEIEAQWSRYDHITGMEEQHNLALSKQPQEVASAYGAMDYQWVVDQVTAGMGILGNVYTGEYSIQKRVTDFFTSAVHSLFNEAQKGHELLQNLGASADDSKRFIGRTINALSAKTPDNHEQNINNMPGQQVASGSDNSSGAGRTNALPDFKAHFASKRSAHGNSNANGSCNLSMEVSQSSNTLQGATQNDTTQIQFRRLLLEYESQGEKQKYEYQWQHNEFVVDRYNQGLLQHGYFKIEDLQQGLLTNADGNRKETATYMRRTEYDANDKNNPSMKNSYIKPKTYIERGHNVNYTA